MKATVFWDVAPYSLAKVVSEVLAVSIIMMSTDCPDDGGSKHLRNVGKLLPDYTAQYLRRVILTALNILTP
jgi:hypothetical protein